MKITSQINSLFNTEQAKVNFESKGEAKVLGSRFVSGPQDPQGPEEIKDALISLIKTLGIMVKKADLQPEATGLDRAVLLQTTCLDLQTMLLSFDLYEQNPAIANDATLKKLVNNFKKQAANLATLPFATRKEVRDDINKRLEEYSDVLSAVIDGLKAGAESETPAAKEAPSRREVREESPPPPPAPSEAEIREKVMRELQEAQRTERLAHCLPDFFDRIRQAGEIAIVKDICLFPTAKQKEERLKNITDSQARYGYEKRVSTRENISSNFRGIINDAKAGHRYGGTGVGYYDYVGGSATMYDCAALFETLKNLARSSSVTPDGEPWPVPLQNRVNEEMGRVWVAWIAVVDDSLRK